MRTAMLRSLLAYLVLAWAPVALAQTDAERDTWLRIFEQSYGPDGMYVVEVAPEDAAGRDRMALQALNAQVFAWMQQNPGKAPSPADLKSEAGFDPADAVWDAEHKMFTHRAGGNSAPAAGAARLLDANQLLRKRILEPDKFTRARWKRIYEDPQAPESLRNEILLREYLIANWDFPAARAAERIQRQLRLIANAMEILSVTGRAKRGDPITMDDLFASTLVNPNLAIPPGATIEVSAIGTPPFCRFEGFTITPDDESVRAVREARAKAELASRRHFAPALILAARFEAPERAVEYCTEAIALWPEVAGLRVERMAHEARRGRLAAWTQDLDFVLAKMPAAPLLIEIMGAGRIGGFANDPKARARLATTLADVRPDLLAQQLDALRALQDAGEWATAASVYDRLCFANPAWGAVFERPAPPANAP